MKGMGYARIRFKTSSIVKNRTTEIAKLLLEIKAVTLNLQKPYRYTSGLLSPIYCDNRLIISYPDKREMIINAFLSLIREKKLDCDVVAGVATAGIPHTAWIADRLKKPMVYVRGKAKEHGKQNQIEGYFKKGCTVLVVEDLISTGASSADAALALREAGAIVHHGAAIFTYELEQAEKNFNHAGVQFETLTNFSVLLEVATQQKMISEEEKSKALEWNQDPVQWGKKFGFE